MENIHVYFLFASSWLRLISSLHWSALLFMCSFFWVLQQTRAGWLLYNASVRESPPRLIVPCSLAGLGNINWTCPERRRFLFWVRILFRLGPYLFRCKSACKECYVLSSGGECFELQHISSMQCVCNCTFQISKHQNTPYAERNLIYVRDGWERQKIVWISANEIL